MMQDLTRFYRRFRLARMLTKRCVNPASYFAQLTFDVRWARAGR